MSTRPFHTYSYCGRLEDKSASALVMVREHCETAPPLLPWCPLASIFVAVLRSAHRSRLLLQSKPVCRMRIPVPAPALPHRRLPPAKPDRETHFARRNGRAKPAWAKPPNCFPPAPKGQNKNLTSCRAQFPSYPGNYLQLLGSSSVSFESDLFLFGIRRLPWKETHDPKMNTINKCVLY